jgi:hypothetical protein
VQTEVVRETVKVTEMHYTERYYGDGTQTYTQTITENAPIEAIAEPAVEIAAEAIDAPAEEVAVVEESSEVVEEALAEEISVEEIEEVEEVEEIEDEPTAERVFEEFYTDVASETVYAPEEDAVEAEEEGEGEERFFDEVDEPVAAEESVEEFIEEPVEEIAEEPVEESYTEETEEPVEEIEESEETVEEAVEEIAEEEDAPEEEEPITYPFRPSFYANRRYSDIPDMPAEENSAEYAEEEYDEEYTEEEYAEEEYADEYAEEEYVEEYAEEEYAEEYAEEEYAEEEYAEEEYAEEEYEEEAPQLPPANPAIALVDICEIEDQFEIGETINLATLKERGLVLPSAQTLKVYASGKLRGPFSVEANHFTLDAIIAISDAGGDSAMIR